MDERMDEILRRLEALERRIDTLSSGEREDTSSCHEHGCPFRGDERRIVDLIVQLTAERIAQLLAESGPHRGPPPPRHHHHPHPHHPHGHGCCGGHGHGY